MKKNFLVLSIILIFVSSVLAAGSGGGGGGSSSGATSSMIALTSLNEVVSDNIKEGATKKIQLSNRDQYLITIDDISVSSASISFKNGVLIIPIDTDKNIDFNDDGYFDVSITFASSSGSTGKFLFKEIHEPVKKSAPSKQDITLPNKNSNLKCGDLNSLKERVACRLDLGSEEQQYENALLFFPEECRALEKIKQDKCIAVYASVQTCWRFEGDERISCVREKMNLKSLAQEHSICQLLTGEARANCVKDYQERAFSVIKFRLYELEERAEEMLANGEASEEQVIDIVAKLEQAKVEFNTATTFDQRRAIILEARAEWINFLGEVNQ